MNKRGEWIKRRKEMDEYAAESRNRPKNKLSISLCWTPTLLNQRPSQNLNIRFFSLPLFKTILQSTMPLDHAITA